MKIVTSREELLKPLTMVGGVVEKRQTLPILANILINADQDRLKITATDLEVELKTEASVTKSEEVDFTLPARKLIDICRALPDSTEISLDIQGEKAVIIAGRSRFTLGVLPAKDYPAIEIEGAIKGIRVQEGVLKNLIDKTQFAMAQQDVRYYLNGLLLEIADGVLRAVATDGHRLAMSEAVEGLEGAEDFQIIIPRKAVLELGRMLNDSDREIAIEVGSNNVRIIMGDTIFTSKLIDGKFPDYQKVVPVGTDKQVIVDRESMRQALHRTSILSNEKYRGIRFNFAKDNLELLAHNPEQEEAKEELEITYDGEKLVIGFNVGYLIEVLTVISGDNVVLELKDENSSCLIRSQEGDSSRYVVMPMRI
ncbi:MAG: DNA polymerase III subunit beta [Gammaproteobacteria bacterium]|nr:DNA polymerase III subunit beta [Gammaproteobacteria bacterium]